MEPVYSGNAGVKQACFDDWCAAALLHSLKLGLVHPVDTHSMNLNLIVNDKPSAPQTSQTPNGGVESFQLAYAKVFDGRQAPAAPPERALTAPPESARPARSPHVVHAGETLSAIVRAQLAASGVTPDIASVRQGIAQIAKANHIGNPDRIQVGLKLDLAPLDKTTASVTTSMMPVTTALRAADSSFDDSERIATPHEVAAYAPWQREDMIAANDIEVGAVATAQLPVATPAYPVADTVTEIDRAPNTPAATRQLALYEQTAAGAAQKPAEPASGVPDIFYKGITGKMLDAVPLEASTRAGLQRANSIVSSTFTARTIGALTGLGGPLGAVAGLVWGIFSSRQIEAAPAGDAKAVVEANPVVGAQPTERTKVAEALN